MDGSPGAHVCDAEGELGPCQCDAGGSGGEGGMTVPASGSGGGGAAGTIAPGWEPVMDLDGSTSAGVGGASAGASDDGGTIMSAGGAGGSIGAAGIGGAAGEPTGGSPVVEDEPEAGEAPYGECRDDGSCDLPMLCVPDVLGGGIESYCAAICGGNGFEGVGCPPRPDGSIVFCVNNLCMR